METIQKSVSKPILVKIAEALLKTQKEIDDLALQFSSGDGEVVEKFEDIKEQAKQTFFLLKQTLMGQLGEKRLHALENQLQDLEKLLAGGKSETLDFFEVQRGKIIRALHNVEKELKTTNDLAYIRNFYIAEGELLKLKLEVLKKRFELKSLNRGHLFKEKMQEARHEIDTLLAKAEDTWDDVKEKYQDFSDEIKQSSKHLKRAIDVL